MKFVVELNDSRKKIIAQSIADVKSQVERKFDINLKNYLMQQYDTEENLFFDVDSDEDLEDGSRIKLIENCKATAEIPIPTASSTIMETSEESRMDEESCSSNHNSDNESSSTCQKEKEDNKVEEMQEDKRPPWPVVFKIPENNLGVALKAKLTNKQQLNTNMRSQLFSSIYDEAAKYYNGNYPNRSQYTLMTNSLLSTYPYLCGKAAFSDSLCYWKTKLNEQFRNNRKRNDRDSPYVKAKLLKYSAKKKVTTEKYVDNTANIWGIKNFLPQRCAGEDDESILQHMKLLDHQYKLVENLQNRSVINISMDKTFPERRAYLLKGNIKSLYDMKSEYPLLFTFHQITAEFKRLTEEDLIGTFITGLQQYSAQIVDLAPFKTEHKLIGALRTKMKAAKLQSKKEYYRSCCALAILPQQLREQTGKMFIFKNEEDEQVHPYPRILIDSENLENESLYQVVAENVVICICEDLLAAYACLFATYYIFNLSYPDKLKSTLNFFQRVIFNFRQSTIKQDGKVSRLVTTLLMN